MKYIPFDSLVNCLFNTRFKSFLTNFSLYLLFSEKEKKKRERKIQQLKPALPTGHVKKVQREPYNPSYHNIDKDWPLKL